MEVFQNPHCSIQSCRVCKDNFPDETAQNTSQAYIGRVDNPTAGATIAKHVGAIYTDYLYLREKVLSSGDAVGGSR
jgi:hypothetical protein